MPTFITESWLRQEFGLAHGSEIHLPYNAKLTPSASQLLNERKIRIKYIDEDGQVYIEEEPIKNEPHLTSVHPLTGGNQRPENQCAVCSSEVAQKTELLTLLDDKLLVPKTHPRISFRGKLDTLIAQTIVVQTQFDPVKKYPLLHKLLADLRSYMGNILRCEVTGLVLSTLNMGDLDEDTIHSMSHQPLKYLGHDHIVPEQGHGNNVALLNLLRALVREAELESIKAFITNTFELTRLDIVQGLNRLSSALYVLMLLTVLSESGVENVLSGKSAQ